MRFWTAIPLFFLLNFAFCGQEEPPQPNTFEATAETDSGELIESTTITVDIGVDVMTGTAPAVFSVPVDRTATVTPSRTFWTFEPASTTIAFGEAEERSFTFVGPEPDVLTIRCLDTASGDPVEADFTLALAEISIPGGERSESVDLSGAEVQIELPLTREFMLYSAKPGWELVPADTLLMLDGDAADIVHVRATRIHDPATLHVTAEDGGGAEIAGVPVFLDGEDTGQTTPAELTLVSTFEYTVSLQSPDWIFTPADSAVTLAANAEETVTFVGEAVVQATHVILLEDFSNVGCAGCPGAEANMLEAMAQEGGANMINLAFHWNNPTAFTDPFFNYKNPPPLLTGPNYLRGDFYAVGASLPRIFIDGELMPDVTVGTFRAAIQAARETEAKVNLAIERAMTADSVTVRVTGTVLSDPGAGPWRLYVIVYEDEIIYDSPPGTNGQTHFHNIVRHGNEYEGELGQPVSLPVDGEIDFTVTFGPDYTEADADHLYALAFIQNPDTKVVLETVVESNGGH